MERTQHPGRRWNVLENKGWGSRGEHLQKGEEAERAQASPNLREYYRLNVSPPNFMLKPRVMVLGEGWEPWEVIQVR